jgi:hypothetical protein
MCHNCETSTNLHNLLKHIDPRLAKEYILERFKDESHTNVPKPDFSAFKTSSPAMAKLNSKKIDLPTIESLHERHAAKKYLIDRKIPNEYFTKIHFAENYKTFVDAMLPDNDKNIPGDPRIVFPFWDKAGALQGFQGRAVGGSAVRYITIKLHEDSTKVFGLDTVDLDKKVYVTEGPIDSLFLNNSIATMDGALYRAKFILGNHDFVFVYDNECRNSQIVRHMKRTIKQGAKICIWPKGIKEKDINDMILSGLNPQDIIDDNTHQGLKAELEFETWKK